MFSFHKPKIYRSLQGCCICRAKSSSSRFTDSKRYECDFDKCFKIDELRQGEICNACVLLVKRWKKLPSGSTRNWHHVSLTFMGSKSCTMLTSSDNGTQLTVTVECCCHLFESDFMLHLPRSVQVLVQ